MIARDSVQVAISTDKDLTCTGITEMHSTAITITMYPTAETAMVLMWRRACRCRCRHIGSSTTTAGMTVSQILLLAIHESAPKRTSIRG
jgi:hypothetical protein